MTGPEHVVLSAEAAAAAAAGEFFDSTRPELIPAGAWAALYHDGDFGPAGIAAGPRFARTRWITIGDDYANCGIADYEPGNPVYQSPGMLQRFVTGRLEAGHRARVYTDRSDAAEALRILGYLAPQTEWWIGLLDGIPRTRQEIAAELAANWGAPIPASRIWAGQIWGGPRATVDKSLLYGTW